MTFVITPVCVADYSCVEVCPVDAIHPTPEEPGFETSPQLFINPKQCIDCEACLEACPVGAIHAEADVPIRWYAAISDNARHFEDSGP